MVIVAHRISTLKDADQIVVFDRGVVIEEGRFTELADDPDSSFGRMRAMQAVALAEEAAPV
jgi:ABC-type multidrug transport system fused ATPase/permease subunit